MSSSVRADALAAAVSRAAPTTFLMTDVEGSTRLWEQQREQMAAALAAHDAILQAVITGHRGIVVKSTGDGVLASFERAFDAAQSALEIQRRVSSEPWPTTEPLRIRVALHTGEAQAREGDFFGPAVNRTARLLAIGYGGQILLSAATAELSRDDLPAGIELVDLGEHRLRDLDRPERVFQLTAPELAQAFPALRSERVQRTNLPAQLTSFVGRQRELAELRQLAGDHRLLTLVGVGGTGKTRLMLELANELLDDFHDGVWLAELASISDAQLVVGQVGRAVGIAEEPGRATIDTLNDYLRDKRLLLLLDNCEHVIAAAAALVQRLLSTCPDVVVFASSREALGIQGEVAYPVPSLAIPAAAEGRADEARLEPPSPESIGASEAVRLFVDRATAAKPSFKLDTGNAAMIADICRRLDGIPLAIELAAARVNVLSVDEIDARLGDRFRLLTGGRRSVLPRQQTLQALIDWSWNLLSDDDRRLLRRLSVFSGGWSLDAAATVTNGATERADSVATLDGLARLIDRSLIQVDHGEATRYWLLETIRQYARDRLVEADEADATRSAHFAFFSALALEAEAPIKGAGMIEWLGRLDAERDNLRAALDWGLDEDTGRAIRMSLALAGYWRVRVFGNEPVERLTRAADLALGRPQPLTGEGRIDTILTARIAAAAALTHSAWGSPAAAVVYAEQALTLARALGDRQALVEALGAAGNAALFTGSGPEAARLAEETVALATEHDDAWTLAMTHLGIALGTAAQGDIVRARHELASATAEAERSGNPFVIAFAALSRGRMAGMLRDAAEARQAFALAGELYQEIGDRRFVLVARSDLGHSLRRCGELDEAAKLYAETIRDWQRLGNRAAVANQLESFAFLALARSEFERAVRLLGAAEALRTSVEAPMLPFEVIEYTESVNALRGALALPAFEDAWRQGAQMSTNEAVDFAVGR